MLGIPTPRSLLASATNRIAPALSGTLASDEFVIATGVRRKLGRELSQRGTAVSGRALHLLNLPAGSDITRLLRQIANVEREVRELRNALADAQMLPGNSTSSPPVRRAQATAKKGTERAVSSSS